MNNVILGKTLKAMYKLSGKTLTQLSDESELTVDTINNLFYARIQKPGFIGICSLVYAMGFDMHCLVGFLDVMDEEENDPVDVSEKFSVYLDKINCSVTADTQMYVAGTGQYIENDDKTVDSADEMVKMQNYTNVISRQIELINQENERQLDRFKDTHLCYVARMEKQYQEQLGRQGKIIRNVLFENILLLLIVIAEAIAVLFVIK